MSEVPAPKKNIDLDAKLINNFWIGLILGFVVVLIVEHMGKFGFLPQSNMGAYALSSRLEEAWYNSPFGSHIEIETRNLTVLEFNSFDYSQRLPYYFSAALNDFPYVLITCGIYILFAFLSSKYRINVS